MRVKGVEYVDGIIKKSEKLLETLDAMGKTPNNKKALNRRFSVKEASDMVGRGRSTLHRLEKEGKIPLPEKDGKTGRTLGYTLEQVNSMRDYFNTRKGRKPNERCIKIAIQSFKGGVSKSVTSVHFAQYLALQGYKVLLVDCDPQASATSMFGYLPDRTFTLENTLLPYFQGVHEDLKYALVETYFAGVTMIPCCLPFYDAEFQLAFAAAEAATTEERHGYFTEIDGALETVEDQFDIILLDSPPSLGMISINILVSADALVVPTPPAMFDFSSTVQYFKMVKKVMSSIIPDKEYDFIKILAARVDTRKSMHKEFLEFMRDIFGQSIFTSVFLQTAEIENSAAEFKTVYDEKKPQSRAINILNSVFSEIELTIQKAWPSRAKELREEGLV